MSSCRGISCRCPARPCTGSSSCQSTSLWRQTGRKKQVWKEARGRQKRISGAGLALWPRVTQQVDDPLVVGGKQPYGVFEEQHERRVDHPVGQLVRAGLSETKRPDISIAAWKLTAWNIQQKEKKKKKNQLLFDRRANVTPGKKSITQAGSQSARKHRRIPMRSFSSLFISL